jgi:hypothetical protein
MAATLALIAVILPSGAPPDLARNMAIGHGVLTVLFTASGLLFRHASLAGLKKAGADYKSDERFVARKVWCGVSERRQEARRCFHEGAAGPTQLSSQETNSAIHWSIRSFRERWNGLRAMFSFGSVVEFIESKLGVPGLSSGRFIGFGINTN